MRTVLSLLAVSVLSVACGSSSEVVESNTTIASTHPASTSTAAPADLAALPGLEITEFVTEFERALGEITSAEAMGFAVLPDDADFASSDIVALEVESVQVIVDGLIPVVLPAQPSDPELAKLYLTYLDGFETWVEGFRTGSALLADERDDLIAAWDSGPGIRYTEITDALYGSRHPYNEACISLTEAIEVATETVLDCFARN